MRRPSPWLLSILFLVAVAWIIASSSTFQGCIQKEQTNSSSQNLQRSAANVVVIYRRCVGGFVHYNAEGIIAGFTIILAFATIFLWAATRDLVKDGRETAKRQLRAYIGVHKMKATIESIEGSDVKVVVSIILKNFGQTPAIVDHVHAQTEFVAAKTGFAALNTDRREILPDAEIETLVEGHTKIYSDLKTSHLNVVTRFRYEDFTGEVHTRDVESHAIIEIPSESLGPIEAKLHNIHNINMPHDMGIWIPSSQSYWDTMKRKKPDRR